MATRAPAVVREFLVDQPLKGLGKLYENSLKALMVCGLEFYLSASLVASFFHCPDETMQAEQELQTLYTLAWVPIFLAIVLVYGPKMSSSIFPLPEHFERNMLRCKILTWIYAFALLIWDPDMIIKTGPSLGVSILFCITDVGRFIMDMKHLTEVEYDENGNSLVVHDKTPTEQQQQQQGHQQPQEQSLQEESYTVQMIGAGGRMPSQRTGQNRQQISVYLGTRQQQLQQLPEQSAPQQQGHKLGSRIRLGSSRNDKRGQDLELDKSPLAIKSEYVAVLDPNADKETAEQIAKKSLTYEF